MRLVNARDHAVLIACRKMFGQLRCSVKSWGYLEWLSWRSMIPVWLFRALDPCERLYPYNL